VEELIHVQRKYDLAGDEFQGAEDGGDGNEPHHPPSCLTDPFDPDADHLHHAQIGVAEKLALGDLQDVS
jgi:hypothetical protein